MPSPGEILAPLQLLISVCFGGVYCFYGYHFLRLLLTVAGAFFGLTVAFAVTGAMMPGNVIMFLVLGVLAGLIGAALFRLVYRFAVFSLGFVAGAFIAAAVARLLPASVGDLATTALAVVICFVCGVAATLLQRTMLIFVTSFVGAFVVVVFSRLLLVGQYRVTPEALGYAAQDTVAELWWLVLLLAAAGILYQRRLQRKVDEA